MVSIKMTFFWQTLIIMFADGVMSREASRWRYSGAAALGGGVALSCPLRPRL